MVKLVDIAKISKMVKSSGEKISTFGRANFPSASAIRRGKAKIKPAVKVSVDIKEQMKNLEKLAVAEPPKVTIQVVDQKLQDQLLSASESSVVSLVNLFIEHAYHLLASDIHFDPQSDRLRARLRVDGVLQESHAIPKNLNNAFISRIKILSGLRTDEHQAAQDGRFRYVTEANETAYQAALIDGVVHYPGTADVGEEGNVYIFGHSSDFAFSKGKFKTVFALLPKIEMGAEVLVSDKDGVQYKYKVYDKFAAEKTDTDVLSQDTNHRSILTLQTSYPIGTALKRYIVKAELAVK